MPVFNSAFTVRAPLQAVVDFHFSLGAFQKLTPPGMPMRLLQADPLAEGSITRFSLGLGGWRAEWVAVHSGVDSSGFTDSQLEGPLARWVHRHQFTELQPGVTRLHDRIAYEYKPGSAYWWTRLLFSPLALRFLFAWRYLATRHAVRRRAG